MQNNQTYSDVLDLVQTKEDFNLINNELDLLEESLFEVKEGYFDALISSSIREKTGSLVLKLMAKNDKKKVIESLKQELLKIKFIEMTFAYDPTSKLVDKILSIVNKRENQKIAIDVKVDQTIIGGALISFEGKIHDGTLSTKLENILKNYV